jgi:subtilisin family serine protease
MKKQATSNKQQATLKIRFRRILIPLFFYMLIPLFSKSQIISNLEWNNVNGISEPYSIAKSLTDNQGNTVTVATKIEPGEDANISVIKFDRAGSIIWQQSYNGVSNAKDYATNLYIDDDYNIFVCGASYDSSTLYDMLVLKYDSAGTLDITMQYDGPANGDDIATAVGLDDVGKIYVTGSSTVSGNMTDFVTVKYGSDGTFAWEAFYDYANGYEVPIGIEFKHDYSSMYISGASASSLTNWDYATINYDLSGTQLGAVRSSSAGIGFDNPMGFFIDSLNNIYITGSAIDSGTTTYNIKTMKLDSALNILWTKTYDADHMNDQGNDLAVDDYGNVYVTGYVMAGNDSSNIAILKYDAAGNLIWSKNYGDRDTFSSDKGKKIVIADNKIFVTGTYEQAGNLNISTFQIDSSGNMMWCKFFDGVGHGFDSPTSLTVTDSNEVIISGISFDGIANTNITYKYSLLRIDSLVVGYNTDSNKYVKGEVIVKFDPAIIDSNFADNINWQFAKLSEIVPDSVVTDIVNAMSYDPAGDLVVVKIYDWMTKSDSLSIARNGDTILMNKLWSTYRLLSPLGYNDTSIMNSLSNLYPDLIYSQLNYLYDLDNIPNDNYKGYQLSLLPTTLEPDAHINMNGAWDIETGKSGIKVGMIENGIDYKHPEFGGGTLATSKFVGGEEFYFGHTLENYYPLGLSVSWHGTATSGIVGAIRNNGFGIAGIAGGDAANNNTGVSLIALECYYLTTATSANAIVKGSSLTTNGGYECDIINASFGGPFWDLTLESAIENCFDNHCVFIASRGNRNADQNQNQNTKEHYPSGYKKEWVICTGSSGNNGRRKKITSNGDAHYESKYDHKVDIIAPGSMDIVLTCQGGPNLGGGFIDGPFTPDDEYSHFSGTSSAAPHVAGLAALMLSHHSPATNPLYPNKLDDGDIQHLLKYYATDVGIEGQTEVGFGLIDAKRTMQHIDLNNGYWVQHSTSNVPGSSYTLSSTLWNNNIAITYSPDIFNHAGFYYNIPYDPFGLFNANLYRHQYIWTIPLPNFVTNPGAVDVIGKWVTHKTGVSDDPNINFAYEGNVNAYISGSNIIAGLETFTWEVYKTYTNNTIIFPTVILPFDINSVPPMISIQLSYPPIVGSLSTKNLTGNQNNVSVYPNPASNILNISFDSDDQNITNIKIFNILGQEVKTKNSIKSKPGRNEIQIDIHDLPSGFYNISISDQHQNSSAKFIVSH